MKRWLVFLLGVLTGAILTVIILTAIGNAVNADSGMSFFDQPGEVISAQSFRVFQTLNNGSALAWRDNDFDLVALLWTEDGRSFYDNQVIKASPKKVFRQIGLYRYSTKDGKKTVPIVSLMDK